MGPLRPSLAIIQRVAIVTELAFTFERKFSQPFINRSTGLFAKPAPELNAGLIRKCFVRPSLLGHGHHAKNRCMWMTQ
jgi:hypothetical protein